MVPGTIAFLLGVICLHQLKELPPIYLAGLPLLLSLSLLFLLRNKPGFLILFYFLFGFSWTLFRASLSLDVALPEFVEAKDVTVTGVISSIPVKTLTHTRFEFDIKTATFQGKAIDFASRVRLNHYHRGYGKRRDLHNLKFRAGQKWQFNVRLKQPHGFMNPGGFDYEGWLFQRRIRATGYIKISTDSPVKLLKSSDSNYSMPVLRQRLFEQLEITLVDKKYQGILVALAIGERSLMKPEDWDVLRNTGTSHLVAISGLHVGLFAGFIYSLALLTWSLSSRLNGLISAPRAAALFAILAATFYAFLSGFAVPAQRALVMILVMMLSLFHMQKVRVQSTVSLALIVVLVYDPISVLSPGFWLSFLAVIIIALSAAARLQLRNALMSWTGVQLRISLALIPILLMFFQHASLISPITNFVAIPLITLIVVPLVLTATSFLLVIGDTGQVMTTLLLNLANETVAGLWWFLSWASSLQISSWSASKPVLVVVILSSLGVAVFLSPLGLKYRLMAIFLLLPLAWPLRYEPESGVADITILDVGQGLAVVVTTANHSLVFDTGPAFSPRFSAGEAVIIPYLRENGITSVDKIIISHYDNDHRGGFNKLKQVIEFKDIITGYSGSQSRLCRTGEQWSWDDVEFVFINQPSPGQSRNNGSCVLKITANNESFLVTADIEAKTEKLLLSQHKNANLLAAKYLLVPHHGSNTSSTTDFIDAVSPDYAFVSAGYKNRYRQPHPDVVRRYAAKNIPLYSTSSSGAILFKIGQKSDKTKIKFYRQIAGKYWSSHH